MSCTTGGGSRHSQRNRDWLKTNPDNIYLKADFENPHQRIDKDHQRPLFLNNSKEEIKKIHERQVWYEEVASRVLDVTKLSPEEIIEEIDEIAYLGPAIFFASCCRQPFPKRKLVPCQYHRCYQGLWTGLGGLFCGTSWNPLKVVSMKAWITFFTRPIHSCRNRSTHSSATGWQFLSY